MNGAVPVGTASGPGHTETSSTFRRPRLGVRLPNFAVSDPGDWSFVFEVARAADKAGVDRLVMGEHVVFGESLDDYARPELGGAAGGKQPTGPDGAWLEPLTLLAAVSSVTTQIRLAPTILLAALRRPVTLAKTTATLDVLSHGRLDLGVGVGWQRAEYDAAGVDFDRRGAALDETLAVLKTLWSDEVSSYHSDTLTFDRIHMQPKPVQKGGVPIWVSGTLNRKVVKRIVEYGSGWIPWGPSAADPGPAIQRIRRELTDAGRDPADFGIMGQLGAPTGHSDAPDLTATFQRARQLAELGVTDFTTALPYPRGEEAIADYLAEVVSNFRAATN